MAAQDSLKVATIFGRTASGSGTGVADLDQEEIRLAVTGALTPGYLRSMIDQTANTSAFNVRQGTGSDMNVKIGSGTTKKDGYVLLGGVAGQGAYIVRLDAATKTVSVPATDATNPARYGVYLYVDDAAYSGTASRAYAQVACIRGTPAGSPVTPVALSTYSAYVLLWEFQLAANATAVTNTILDAGTDRRRPSTPTTGGGLIAYARQSSAQTSISTETDLTSLTVTPICKTGRIYRVHVHVYGVNSTTQDLGLLVKTGTSGTGSALTPDPVQALWNGQLSGFNGYDLFGYFTADGAYPIHARLSVTTGTFNTSTNAGNFITVEDFGPA